MADIDRISIPFDFATGRVSNALFLAPGDVVLAGYADVDVPFDGAQPDVYLVDSRVNFPTDYNYLDYFHVDGASQANNGNLKGASEAMAVDLVLGKDTDGTPPGSTVGRATLRFAILRLR